MYSFVNLPNFLRRRQAPCMRKFVLNTLLFWKKKITTHKIQKRHLGDQNLFRLSVELRITIMLVYSKTDSRKHFRSNELSVKWTFLIKWPFGQRPWVRLFSKNGNGPLFEKNVWSKNLSVKWPFSKKVFGHMTFRSNYSIFIFKFRSNDPFPFFRGNDLSVKIAFG
jgi:hypothetical protein